MRSAQYVHGLQFAAGAGNRRWAVKSSSDCGEDDQIKAQNGIRTGNKQSWGGEESPVSVIGHNCMMQSHPSSGSTSMEHPIFTTSATPPPTTAQLYHRLSHHPDHYSLSSTELPPTSQFLPESATSYAGLLSERVQQAFRKSHELQQPHVVKMWPTSATNKRMDRNMDWLNLQEDPPLINAGNKLMSTVPQYSRQSRPLQAVADSTDHVSQEQYDRASSEEERLSVYSSTRGSDRQEDEDGVIDFFPSAARPSSVNYMHRESRSLGSNGRSIKVEENRRGSLKRRSSCIRSAGRGHPNIIQYTGPIVDIVDAAENIEGRASTSSYKWDDAERWLTSPTTSASAPLLHQQPPPSFSIVDLHGLAKAAPCVPRVQARIKPQLMSEPTSTQDKHVPVSGDSHAFMREAGTELRKRDMATQSTPAQWSRCDSPEEERAILSTTPNKKPGAHQLGPVQEAATAPQKTSPPRHNTPARRSVSCTRERGNRINPLQCEPLHFNSGKLNMLELESCHLDKLKLARDLPLGTSSSWLLFAEDESQQTESKLLERKSPPHHLKVNMLEARVSAWEDVERAKHIAKFKKEEAKIEAWESLQRAGADAELRKLEVKLEKMRFEGREKIMGRLGAAQKRAQEMRGVAEAQKVEQLTRVVMRANHIRKSGQVPSSTFNVMCSLTTKIKPTSNLSFS